MPKLIAALWFTLPFVFPTVGKAAYIIKLKNGNEFITGRYWHEGRQLMFDAYGGVFGIEPSELIGGIDLIPRARLAKLFGDYDGIWHW